MPGNKARLNKTPMFTGPYVPWEHYPKTLRHYEVQDPILVLADFFSADSVKGHGKRLKEWRYYAVNDQHYDEKRHGPSSLLFVYDMNLRFIEAMYLLLCNYKQEPWKYKKPDETNLEEEREQWEYYPENLSLKQQLNPYRAVNKFFKHIPPQQYRDYLHEWLHSAMYNEANPEDLYAGEVITVYENMLKLYSAGWMICQRESREPKLKRNVSEQVEEKQVQHEQVPNELTGNKPDQPKQGDKPMEIRAIDPFPTEAEKLALEQIKNLIVKRCPNVQLIIHLGVHEQPFTFYLVILVAGQEKTPEHEISNKIEDNCRYLANVYAIVHKASSVKIGISSLERFWTAVFRKGYIIYQDANLTMPEPGVIANSSLIEKAASDHERWATQAKAFYDGAKYYLTKDNYRLAVFLLHQAAESTLIAVIRCISGYRVQMHNLSRLLRLTMLFTDELKAVFRLDTLEGSQLFELLQSAYAKSRYSSSFNPDEASVKQLAEKISTLIARADEVYRQYLNKLKNEEP